MTPACIVLVDDSELFRRGLAVLINAQPDLDVVGQAEDGLEAVRLARDLQPDLVVMDISMPICDGLEATRLIRGLNGPAARTPIVVLTSHSGEELEHAAAIAGANAFLSKTVDAGTLLRGIRDALVA